MSQQLALMPGLQHVNQTGDPLERHYTLDRLALAATERLHEQVGPFFGRGPRRLAELHVGGGAWVRAARQVWARSVRILAVDIDPHAAGLRMPEVDKALCGDVLEPDVQAKVAAYRPTLVLGNPPFSHAIEHLAAVRQAAPDAVIAWVLPLDLYSVAYWLEALETTRPRLVWPLEGRPWPASVRGCAVWVWLPRPWLYARGDELPADDRDAVWTTEIRPLRWK